MEVAMPETSEGGSSSGNDGEEVVDEKELRPPRAGGWPPELDKDPIYAEPSGSMTSGSIFEIRQSAVDSGSGPKDDKKNKKDVMQHGVPQWIYSNWIKDEIEREAACLELPFTILLLVAFSVLAIHYIGQETVTIVEEAVVNDIVENANFAWAHNFGHKGIDDVNNFADFWSWCRLGFIPLVAPRDPWMYSEDLGKAVPQRSGLPTYDATALPKRWPMPGYRQDVPVRNDYLRYARIVGGFRFRQTVTQASDERCIFPGDTGLFRQWLGKPCTGRIDVYLPPDLYATEALGSPERVEWFFTETEDHDTLLQRAIDMEDGCVSARAQNRSCLCTWCQAQSPPHPWLNELTARVEISFVIYNAQYGLYSMALINFWFSRTGQIHKLVDIKTSWAGLLVRDYGDLAAVALSGVIWLFSIVYVAHSEAKEIIDLLRTKRKPWYLVVTDHYIGFWNCVDWISIAIAAAITGLFVRLNLEIMSVNSSLADFAKAAVPSGSQRSHARDMEQIRSFYDKVENMTSAESMFRIWLCVYPVILMLRLFKSFAAQPRLAVVTNTFKTAWDDLVHFALVFFSVYLCMAVNAILFFGQDSVDFSTIDRAFHSCFMAMLGSWDWEEMKGIGLIRAFLWLFAFMLIMVMLLLNMLLAIIMESYSQVKVLAENEPSLGMQIQNMIRRFQQNRRGERVRLKDIWAALLKYEGHDDDAMLRSDRVIFPRFLVDIVPGIPKSQALRTLTTSKEAYDLLNQEPFDPKELKETLERTEQRLDNMVLCATWLTSKLQSYDQQMKAASEEARRVASRSRKASQTSLASSEEDEDDIQGAIEAVKEITQERTMELADGVASVLGEEMRGLERRQAEQQRSMKDMHQHLVSLRRLIYKLSKTTEEVGQLASTLDGNSGGLGDVQVDSRPDHNATAASVAAASVFAQQLLHKEAASVSGLRPRHQRRNGQDPFHNGRFSAAVGGTKGPG